MVWSLHKNKEEPWTLLLVECRARGNSIVSLLASCPCYRGEWARMVRGSRTPPQPQPMMAARVDEKGRKWGPGRSVPRPHFPFLPSLELAPGTRDLGSGLDLAQSGRDCLLHRDSAWTKCSQFQHRGGETRGRRKKRGVYVPALMVRRICRSLPENCGLLMHRKSQQALAAIGDCGWRHVVVEGW